MQVFDVPFGLYHPFKTILNDNTSTGIVVVLFECTCHISDGEIVLYQGIVVHRDLIGRDKPTYARYFRDTVHTHKRIFVVVVLQGT